MLPGVLEINRDSLALPRGKLRTGRLQGMTRRGGDLDAHE